MQKTGETLLISTLHLVAKSGNKLTLLPAGILNLHMSYHTLLIQAENKQINNSL